MKPLYIWKFNDDSNLTFVEMVENYDTLIWTKRFYIAGEFELYNSDVRIMRYVGNNYAISLDNKGTDLMFIENGTVTIDENNKPTYKIAGRDLLALLDRRVMANKMVINGEQSAKLAIATILKNTIISPQNSIRTIQRFRRENPESWGEGIKVSLSPDSVLTITSRLCEDNGFGQKVERDISGNLTYSFCESVEKEVYFNRIFDNLLTTEYSKATNDSFNVGYVTDSNDNIHEVAGSPNPIGICRIEKVVTSEADQNDYSTEGDFIAALYQDAFHQMYLNENDAFRCEVDPLMTYEFGTDYDVGDIVKICENHMKAKARIVEAIKSFDSSGDRIAITFEITEVLEWL